jgi:hypothetical protein
LNHENYSQFSQKKYHWAAKVKTDWLRTFRKNACRTSTFRKIVTGGGTWESSIMTLPEIKFQSPVEILCKYQNERAKPCWFPFLISKELSVMNVFLQNNVSEAFCLQSLEC